MRGNEQAGDQCPCCFLDDYDCDGTLIAVCAGTMDNGPGKRFARCHLCRRIDYELCEGDVCRQPLQKEGS